MTYELYGQPLPTFDRGGVRAARGRQARARGAHAHHLGPNIRGFIMYNSFSPSCTEVTNERLILTAPPWDGDFNTVQLPPGRYCPPGAG